MGIAENQINNAARMSTRRNTTLSTLTEEEKEKSKEELGKILNYVDMLNELDTTGVEEMSHPFSFTNNFREDEAVNTENREALLANAPEQKDGCFKVPQTVE